MKRKIFLVAISLILIVCMFAGCVNENISAHITDPLAYSGKLEDYAKFSEEDLQQNFLNKHIEVTGIVTSTGHTLFYVGKYNAEAVYFACSFAEHSYALEQIVKGSEITVHGVCTSVFNKMITLEGCQLTAIDGNTPPADPEPSEGESAPEESGAATEPGASEQAEATEGGEESSATAEGDEMVWIPTNGGEKYHTSETCSDMIDPQYVTLAYADEHGFTPCTFCYG